MDAEHIYNKNINTAPLELDKVLKMLSDLCTGAKAKKAALELMPSSDIYTVKTETARTAAALEMTITGGSPIFYSLDGSDTALKRCRSGAQLSLAELISIRRLLTQINSLYDWKAKSKCERSELNFLFESLFPDKRLENKLDSSIISENELADDASHELASIRKKIAACGLKIRDSLEKMIRSSSMSKYLQENIITMRDGRYVLPVRSEYKNNVPGMVHGVSSSGSTLFIEPAAVVEANNDIKILEGRELDEINRIIKELSAECAQCGQQLESGLNAAAELELYFAKAELAAKMKAAEPQISDDGVIILKKARHPLIDPKRIVPIDLTLGESYHSLVITGPNTGGKTVLLKTVGLLTLMTMCGLLIPAADGSKISVFKKILVDIGDSQSIEMDLSTFSAHMGDVADILKRADSESLVLLDELGSGTDPVEGAALAVAILEQLMASGAESITTTHYQEIKLFALETDDIDNAACEFDAETLSPTYRIIIGTPGKSNAFAISKRLGIPDSIIERAGSLVSEENKRFENVIESLEKTRIELESKTAEAQKMKEEAERLSQKLAEDTERFEQQKLSELEKARKQAAAIVASVERQSRELIEELDSIRKQKDKENFSEMTAEAKRRQRSAVNKLYLEANPVTQSNDNYVLPRPLKKGDRVILADSGRKAVLSSEPDQKGMCFVQMGAMRTKVDSARLRLDESTQKQSPKSSKGSVTTKGVQSRMTRKIQSELDIRGQTCDEGIYELDSFIDQAVLSGISIITVIHGIGTGALKNAVRNHLKHHPSVKSSRRGLYGEGEDGVTIIELK